MHLQKVPPESFLSKAERVVNQGVSVMGTLKGAYELGKGLYQGFQAVRPLAMALI